MRSTFYRVIQPLGCDRYWTGSQLRLLIPRQLNTQLFAFVAIQLPMK
jgi:hypothetical protein